MMHDGLFALPMMSMVPVIESSDRDPFKKHRSGRNGSTQQKRGNKLKQRTRKEMAARSRRINRGK
jgi:hypothetical protein